MVFKKKLHLNKDKCKCVVYAFKSPRWVRDFFLETNTGDEIERVDVVTYLGVEIDGKLTWKQNSIKLQEKLRKMNYLFYHLKEQLSKKHLIRLYAPLYESVLIYGIIHWGGSAHTNPLKVLQNKVCRLILNTKRRSSEWEICPKLGFMSLEDI